MVYRKIKMNKPSPIFITDNIHNEFYRNKVKKAMFTYYTVDDDKDYLVLLGREFIPDFKIKPSMVFTAIGFSVIFEKDTIVNNEKEKVTKIKDIKFDKINNNNETVNRFSYVKFDLFTYELFISLIKKIVFIFDKDTTKDDVIDSFAALRSPKVKPLVVKQFTNIMLRGIKVINPGSNPTEEMFCEYMQSIWRKEETDNFISELYDIIVDYLYKEVSP